jgi:hypothetical protein
MVISMKLSIMVFYLLVSIPLPIKGELENLFRQSNLIPAVWAAPIDSDSSKQDRKSECTTCPQGIGSFEGDRPILKCGFSNAETLLVCGSLESRISNSTLRASEFEIISCRTSRVLLTVGADEDRIIRCNPDLLELTQSFSLPTDSNWKYREFPLQQWYFKLSSDSVLLLGPTYVFKQPILGEEWIRRALTKCDSLLTSLREAANLMDVPYELYMDLLFCCMIAGNKSAEDQFHSLTNEQFMDGHIAETYSDISELWVLIKGHVKLK